MAALIIIFLKDIFKKSKKIEIIVDPQTEALSNLDNLYSSGAVKNGEPRVFYYRVSEILRIYISKKYNFNAMEMTSSELLKKLETVVPVSITKKDLKEYLKIFDLARYAGFKPSQNDMLESLEKTKEFIRKL